VYFSFALWPTIFLIGIMGGEVQLGPFGTAATNIPIVPAPGDYDDGEMGGMIGKGNQSARRKPAPVPLCPPQIPHAARTRPRAAAVGSQLLIFWATARPLWPISLTSSPTWNKSSGFVHVQFMPLAIFLILIVLWFVIQIYFSSITILLLILYLVGHSLLFEEINPAIMIF
jgi:hypothetical protein